MTMMEFFGCTFIAFGAPLAMFIFTIARDPLRVIVFMASAFFWLLGLLLSSLLWFAVVPLRNELAFGLVFSVLLQEVFRLVFYFILKKADQGLAKVSEREGATGITIVSNKHLLAYVSGFGFGAISGAFSLINVLADMTGPGTIGIYGHSDMFFITSALLTLCFVMLHTFWGVIFFAGLEKKNYVMPAIVLASHMLVSCLTLLNQSLTPVYLASVLVSYIVMVATGVWAFFVAGGSLSNIKACCTGMTSSYGLS